jgi:hypothetical protein
VGFLYRCTDCGRGFEGSSFAARELSLFPSVSSSELRTMVQPGGNGEWWFERSLLLKNKPPKTGDMVRFPPWGRCTAEGAMIFCSGVALKGSDQSWYRNKWCVLRVDGTRPYPVLHDVRIRCEYQQSTRSAKDNQLLLDERAVSATASALRGAPTRHEG